jgi:photosystem II stability/assembly factor-like uncharacterized protein
MSWIPLSGLKPGGSHHLAIDPQNSRTIYASDNGELTKSTDAGESWVALMLAAPAGPIAIDPQNPQVVYVGTSDYNLPRVFKSIDGGNTWIAPGFALSDIVCGQSISSLAIDPQTPSNVYAATSDCNDQGGWLWRSQDGGATWGRGSTAGSNVYDRTPYVYGTPIAVDPHNPNTLFADAGPVVKSTNGGESWSVVTGRQNLTAMAIDPEQPGTLYSAFLGQGVFKSVDGGANWIELNDGLSNLNVHSLVLSAGNPNTLYAGTPVGAFRIFDDSRGRRYPRRRPVSIPQNTAPVNPR